ncbi:uncharacterized protein TNCV_752081 [Trichonephila clavipes]|uniref:Uncharacterized protein n=1 Tax=Trichonephila clavipes TaxID=2585209 RepID=A0A8X7BH98_TRICX|nr:uncharacterized protein TNCV_752081 [Trichonephila clavipes]
MQSHSFLCYLASGNRYCDAENCLRTKGQNIHQCAKKICALQTVLEAKREEFVDGALIYAKSLCEELEISFEPPRRIRRKHTFGEGSKDVQLSYDDDLRPKVILRPDELNLDQPPRDINKEKFQLQRVRLQTIFAATDPGSRKELIRSGFLGVY